MHSIKELEEFEERYRQVAENAEFWVWELDANGMFIYSSPVVEKIIGCKPEDIVGEKNFLEIFKFSGKEDLRLDVIERFKNKRSFNGFIFAQTFHDGEEKRISVSGIPIFNEAGKHAGFRGTCYNIAQQEKGHSEIKKGQEYLKSLADGASNLAVYCLQYDDNPSNPKLVFASRALENILGEKDPYTLESWYGSSQADTKTGEDTEKIARGNTGRLNKTMRIYNTKKGEWRWIHAISDRVLVKDEKIKYVNGIVLDITREKMAEKKLRKREKELRAKTNSLEAVNTALKVLLKRRDEDRAEIEEKVYLTVKQLVEPYVERLNDSKLDPKQRGYVEVLKSNLSNIVSPFSHTLSSKYFSLTPSEIKIANLIKQGNTTKEIAALLNLTPRTVSFHRENIRRKIGVKNRKINLHARLQSFK
jgi:PAS domain S-box-containing protein